MLKYLGVQLIWAGVSLTSGAEFNGHDAKIFNIHYQRVRYDVGGILRMKTYASWKGPMVTDRRFTSAMMAECHENAVKLNDVNTAAGGHALMSRKALVLTSPNYEVEQVDLQKMGTMEDKPIVGLILIDHTCTLSKPAAPWKSHYNVYSNKVSKQNGKKFRMGLRISTKVTTVQAKPAPVSFIPVFNPSKLQQGVTFVGMPSLWVDYNRMLMVRLDDEAEIHRTTMPDGQNEVRQHQISGISQCAMKRTFPLEKEVDIVVCPAADKTLEQYHKDLKAYPKTKASPAVGFIWIDAEPQGAPDALSVYDVSIVPPML